MSFRLLPATVSVAATALALGVGIGAGPLADSSAQTAATRESRLVDRVERQADRLERLSVAAHGDRLAIEALAGPLVTGRLADRSVVVVAAPGAVSGDVQRVRQALAEAGATVTGTLALHSAYVDPDAAASPLEDLALRLVPPGVTFPEDASSIERVGTVLARSVVQDPKDPRKPEVGADPDAAEVLAGFQELDALTFTGEPGVRALLAVLVAPPDAERAQDVAIRGLLRALDAGSRGTVLVSRFPSAGPADGWSSVGGIRSAAGAAGLLLALAEQDTGGSGAYGTGPGASSVLPPVGPAD